MTHVQTDRAPQPKHRTSSQPRHTHHQLHHALNRTPAVVLFLKISYMLPSHQQTTSNAWNRCQNSHQWSRSWILVPCQLAFRLHPKLQGHFSMLHLWKAPLQKTAEDLLSKSPSIQKVWTNRLQKVNRRMMNQPASQWLIVLPDGQKKTESTPDPPKTPLSSRVASWEQKVSQTPKSQASAQKIVHTPKSQTYGQKVSQSQSFTQKMQQPPRQMCTPVGKSNPVEGVPNTPVQKHTWLLL